MNESIELFVYEYTILGSAGICVLVAVSLSLYLIRQHFLNFTQPHIQSKIIAVTYMIPIYSIDSYFGLIWPNAALYINMFRDCYEVGLNRQQKYCKKLILLFVSGLCIIFIYVLNAFIPKL